MSTKSGDEPENRTKFSRLLRCGEEYAEEDPKAVSSRVQGQSGQGNAERRKDLWAIGRRIRGVYEYALPLAGLGVSRFAGTFQ